MPATAQPDWEYVGNLGDMNPVEYGGFLVFRDRTGVYDPEAEVWEPEDCKVYRFPLEPPRFKTLTTAGKRGWYLSRESLLAPANRGTLWYWYREWWAETGKLTSAARSAGLNPFSLARMAFSKDPMVRGAAYQVIIGHWGLYEFDHYPLELSSDDYAARLECMGVLKPGERRVSCSQSVR